MITHPYWVTTMIAIIPRPRGGDWLEDEMSALKVAGIDVVVSMLESDEAKSLGLELERNAAEQTGLSFINFPIKDRSTPETLHAFNAFLSLLEKHENAGRRIGIHCRASIGRSSVVTASLLGRLGISLAKAWNQIAEARGCTVPDTLEQKEWVNKNFGNAN